MQPLCSPVASSALGPFLGGEARRKDGVAGVGVRLQCRGDIAATASPRAGVRAAGAATENAESRRTSQFLLREGDLIFSDTEPF